LTKCGGGGGGGRGRGRGGGGAGGGGGGGGGFGEEESRIGTLDNVISDKNPIHHSDQNRQKEHSFLILFRLIQNVFRY
jgi:hypothetical protein